MLITDLTGKLNDSSMNYDRIIKSVPVVIGTCDCDYSGLLVHFNFERLLDVLNDGSVGDQPELPSDFIQLHHAEICPDGQNTTSSADCLIAKKGILFVGEKMTLENKNPRVQRERSRFFVPKSAIRVEIHLPSLVITGNIYIELWQRLVGAFSNERMFVPVTNARLSRPDGRSFKFEFVAVNRNQINSITQKE
jgi:hypothetical protein